MRAQSPFFSAFGAPFAISFAVLGVCRGRDADVPEDSIRVIVTRPGSQEGNRSPHALSVVQLFGQSSLLAGPVYYSGFAKLFHRDEGLCSRAIYHIQRLANQDAVEVVIRNARVVDFSPCDPQRSATLTSSPRILTSCCR